MKRTPLLVLFFIVAIWGTAWDTNAVQNTADDKETDPLVLKKLEWFQDVKFGLMMHWGPYSQWGVVESWSICSGHTQPRSSRARSWMLVTFPNWRCAR